MISLRKILSFFVELEMGPREQFFFGLYPIPKDTADHSLVTDSRKTFVCAHTHMYTCVTAGVW